MERRGWVRQLGVSVTVLEREQCGSLTCVPHSRYFQSGDFLSRGDLQVLGVPGCLSVLWLLFFLWALWHPQHHWPWLGALRGHILLGWLWTQGASFSKVTPSRWGSRGGTGKDLPRLPTGPCQPQGCTDGHVSSQSSTWKLKQVVSLSLLAYSVVAVADLLSLSHSLISLSIIKIPDR